MDDSKLKENDVRHWLKDNPTLGDYAAAPFKLARRTLKDVHPIAFHGVASTAYGLTAVGLVIGSNYITGGWGLMQMLLFVLAAGLTAGGLYSGNQVLDGTPTHGHLSEAAEIGSFFATIGSTIAGLLLITSAILFPHYNDFYQMNEMVLPKMNEYRSAIQEARENDESISLGSFVANGRLPASACDAEIVRDNDEIHCGVAGDQQLTVEYGPQQTQVGFEETEDGALVRMGNMDREDYAILKDRLAERRVETFSGKPRFKPAGYQDGSGYFLLPEADTTESLSLSAHRAQLQAEQLKARARIEQMEKLMSEAMKRLTDTADEGGDETTDASTVEHDDGIEAISPEALKKALPE